MVTDRVGPTITTLKAEVDYLDGEVKKLLNLLADARTESMKLRADLRLAIMSDSEECRALSQEVERLVKSRNRWGQKYNALLEKHKRLRAANETWASAYHAEYYVNERLRAALEQIAEGRVSDHPPTLWAFARAALEGK